MQKRKRKIKKRENFFSIFSQSKTYLNIIYLLLLFPLGIISFTIVVTLLAISLSLIITPFYAPFAEMTIGTFIVTALHLKIILSLIVCIIGIFILIGSLYIINGLSWLFKKILSAF